MSKFIFALSINVPFIVRKYKNNPIDILMINSISDDSLDYERKDKEKKAWNIIVVGGAAVARGITLEGLNVSYFTRLAKLPTSDTLIQMGRWFGYRIGYEDLWRVTAQNNFIFYLDNSHMLWKKLEP